MMPLLFQVHQHKVFPNDIEYAAIQRVRKKILLTDCSKRTREDVFPRGSSQTVGIHAGTFGNIIVSDKHQLLYCATPKIACTNWKRVFLVLEGYCNNTKDIKSSFAHNQSTGFLKRLSDYSPREITFRLSSYYKFLFVRHPFERLVSAYKNKFIDSKYTIFRETYGRYIMKKYRKKGKSPDSIVRVNGTIMTFKEFANFIVDSPIDDKDFWNEHWERIDRICHPCLLSYDFIGKLETLGRDSDYLLRSLELSDKVQFPINQTEKRSPYPSSRYLTETYIQELPIHITKKLVKLFKHDFQMFNYKPTEIN